SPEQRPIDVAGDFDDHARGLVARHEAARLRPPEADLLGGHPSVGPPYALQVATIDGAELHREPDRSRRQRHALALAHHRAKSRIDLDATIHLVVRYGPRDRRHRLRGCSIAARTSPKPRRVPHRSKSSSNN